MARFTYLISTLGLLGLGACVDNSDSIIAILQNNAPDPGCVVAGGVSDTYIGSGVIEAQATTGYVFTPVLQSFATETDTGPSKIAIIHGATVDITFRDADLFDDATEAEFVADGLTHFRVPYSGMIEPGGTTSMLFEVVPPELLAEIAPLLTEVGARTLLNVAVSVDGEVGSSDFTTKDFNYPVEVCNGCLVNIVASCAALPMEYAPANTGGPCNVFQDDSVDCCLSGTTAVCPAIGTMPPAAQ